MLEERLNEVCTSSNVQIRSFLLLDFGDFFRNISIEKHGRLPLVRSDGMRGDLLGCCVDGWPNVIMLRPELCPKLKRSAPGNKSKGMFIPF